MITNVLEYLAFSLLTFLLMLRFGGVKRVRFVSDGIVDDWELTKLGDLPSGVHIIASLLFPATITILILWAIGQGIMYLYNLLATVIVGSIEESEVRKEEDPLLVESQKEIERMQLNA